MRISVVAMAQFSPPPSLPANSAALRVTAMEHHGPHTVRGKPDPELEGTAAVSGTVKDPVCGMTVDPAKTAHHADHAGHSYHFCSAGCRTKFIAEPGKYLQARAPLRAEAVAPGTIYTCPMHPQIRQPGPGSCPICGMALEPVTPSAEAVTPLPGARPPPRTAHHYRVDVRLDKCLFKTSIDICAAYPIVEINGDRPCPT